MIGLSTIGSISLGCALVAGRKRVPSPAAGKTALRTFAGINYQFGAADGEWQPVPSGVVRSGTLLEGSNWFLARNCRPRRSNHRLINHPRTNRGGASSSSLSSRARPATFRGGSSWWKRSEERRVGKE